MKEPKRYLHNANDLLKKAGRENGYYNDPKYVRMACGTAYNGVLLAIDKYLENRNRKIHKKNHQRKNVKDYKNELAVLNKKLLSDFETTYEILHLVGYYDGLTNRKVIDAGIEVASEIITGIETNKF